MSATTNIKTYTKKDLCNMYNISRAILKTWFVKIKKQHSDFDLATTKRHFLTPKEYQIFIEIIGEP